VTNVLVGCESSGRVRDALLSAGVTATSCDLLESESPGPHILGDVRPQLHLPWRGAILHPDCRYLAMSGLRWLYHGGRRYNPDGTENPRDLVRWRAMREACAFYAECWHINSERVAVENSAMHPYALAELRRLGVPVERARLYQPWMFASDEEDNVKKGLFLLTRGLPDLVPLGVFDGTTARAECHRASPGPNRWRERSRTRKAVASAIAKQWGPLFR
jgi:hypothetical protein